MQVDHLRKVYDRLNELALVNDVLRISGIEGPLIASLNAHLGHVVRSFERLRIYSDYRTPSSIRAFIHLCIVIVPLLIIPVFADLATQQHPYAAYAAAFVLPFPFMLLSNVQKGLEHPFTGLFDNPNDNPDGIQLKGLQMVRYMSETEALLEMQRMRHADDAAAAAGEDAEAESLARSLTPSSPGQAEVYIED